MEESEGKETKDKLMEEEEETWKTRKSKKKKAS